MTFLLSAFYPPDYSPDGDVEVHRRKDVQRKNLEANLTDGTAGNGASD